jgi:hypothetical protein
VLEKEAFDENLVTRYRDRWGEVNTGLAALEEHRITQLPGVVVGLGEGVESGSRGMSKELTALAELCA